MLVFDTRIVIKFFRGLIMGQITINTPDSKKVHYEIETTNEYHRLLEFLDELCRKENPHLTAEDLDDIRYAQEILENGEFITLDEAERLWNK